LRVSSTFIVFPSYHVWPCDDLEAAAEVAKSVIGNKLLQRNDLLDWVPALSDAQRLSELWPRWGRKKKREKKKFGMEREEEEDTVILG